MRCLAIYPLVCAIIAFVLALLCVLAGSKPGYIEDAAILTLNTSRLGRFDLPDSITPTSTGPFSSIASKVINGVEKVGGQLADDALEELGLKDFYSVHLMTFCEGSFTPNETVRGAKRNVSECSAKRAMYSFDPRAIVQAELKTGVSLVDDLKWPAEIDDGIRALRTAFRAMFVVYVIAIILAGGLILTSAAGVFSSSRLFAVMNTVVALMAFFALGVASAIAHALVVKASNVINDNGADIGLAAIRGRKFLAMSWAGTALLLSAFFAWVGASLEGTRQKEPHGRPARRGFFGRREEPHGRPARRGLFGRSRV
ncbi:MAG: hypothetical protein M1832_005466 [Thelocarpon impressellum]|nr:MAG: hypothetical protein M1832_005466 [Thelocarpon impressellum]